MISEYFCQCRRCSHEVLNKNKVRLSLFQCGDCGKASSGFYDPKTGELSKNEPACHICGNRGMNIEEMATRMHFECARHNAPAPNIKAGSGNLWVGESEAFLKYVGKIKHIEITIDPQG